MSILYAKGRITSIREFPLLASEVANVNQEGMAMTLAGYEAGIRKVRASAGVDDTEFAGVSFGPRFGAPSRKTKIEVVTSVTDGGSAAKITLSRAPLTGTIFLATDGTGWGTGTARTEVTSGTPTNAQYKINPSNDKEILLHVDNIAKSVFVVYEYTPSVLESRADGDKLPGIMPSVAYGTVGVLTSGTIWTDMYDHAANWSAVDTIGSGEFLKAGANGRFTISGNGANLAGIVSVLELPTVDQPYLGLWIRVD